MRLLIDGRVLKHKYITGVERYTHCLIGAFKRIGLSPEILIPGTNNRYLQHLWENISLPIKAQQYDVLFCPGNISPLWKAGKCRYVTTIHDISFKSFKDAYSFPYRFYHDITIRRVLDLADAIIAISNFEKEMISINYPEIRKKIRVVYNGVDERLAGRQVINEKGNYILYVGSLNKRKNLNGLIEAFLKIKDKIPHVFFWLPGLSKNCMAGWP